MALLDRRGVASVVVLYSVVSISFTVFPDIATYL